MCPFLCAILPFLILGYVNFLFSILYTIKSSIGFKLFLGVSPPKIIKLLLIIIEL